MLQLEERVVENKGLLTYEKELEDIKAKLEMMSESFETLTKRLNEKSGDFAFIKDDEKKFAENLNSLEEKFKNKMEMTKSIILEIQDFINKVERRLLQVERVIFCPTEDLICEENLGLEAKKNKRGKLKTKN